MEQKALARKGQEGFTLMELVLVLGALVVLISLSFFAYKKVSEGTEIEDRTSRTYTLITELERFRNDNNGLYPTGTCNASSCTLSATAQGYIDNYYWGSGWTYQCNSGGNPSISISGITDVKEGTQIAGRLNSTLQSQGASCSYNSSSQTVTCTLANRRC